MGEKYHSGRSINSVSVCELNTVTQDMVQEWGCRNNTGSAERGGICVIISGFHGGVNEAFALLG